MDRHTDGDWPAGGGPEPALPRAPLLCLPLLWRRSLFPGVAPRPTRVTTVGLLLVLVLPALLLYPRLDFHLLEPDEGRYAEIPRELLARGDWVVPHLQGEPYLDKPPLLYWLVALSYTVFGVSPAAARLVPALAVHATVLAVYLIGRRSVGERAARLGALALALAPGFVGVGRLLVLDGLLALWVTLAILAAFEALRGGRTRPGWWLLASAALGLGVLTKGPVILILVAAPLALHRLLTGGCRVGVRPLLTAA